jgi:hypothetical protein
MVLRDWVLLTATCSYHCTFASESRTQTSERYSFAWSSDTPLKLMAARLKPNEASSSSGPRAHSRDRQNVLVVGKTIAGNQMKSLPKSHPRFWVVAGDLLAVDTGPLNPKKVCVIAKTN